MEEMEKKKKYTLRGNISYAYRVLFKVYPRMRWMFAAQVILSVTAPVMGNLTAAAAISCITQGRGAAQYMIIMAAILLGNGLIRYFKKFIESWNEIYMNNTQNNSFLLGLVRKSLDADYENVETAKQQRMMNKATHAVNVYRTGVSLIYIFTPVFLATVIGTVLYSLTISALDIRIFLVIVLMTLSGMFWEKRARNVENGQREEQFRLWGRFYYLQEQTTGVKSAKDLRIYNMADWFDEGFGRLIRRNRKLAKGKHGAWFMVGASDSCFTALRDGIAYGILIWGVLRGRLSLAQFTFCLGIVAGISNWIVQLREGFSELQSGSNMLCEYRKMMDYPNRFPREGGLKVSELGLDGRPPVIEFRGVSYRYEEAEKDTLKNLSFTIHAGEKLALVGHNGAGKTTLVKLLCGLYHPTAGEILVAGHSIEKYDLNEYYKLLSTVFQEVGTLPLSIAGNVSGQKQEETDNERVLECLRRAGLAEDVEKLDKKEQTYLTQTFDPDGVELSGGQLQKLMLARAIYKDAPILILDEPTAALDPIAESNMYQEYEKITNGKTSLFISHRLASTKFCDRILYMENGEIVEEGTHEGLLEKGGKYAEVYEVQRKYYE